MFLRVIFQLFIINTTPMIDLAIFVFLFLMILHPLIVLIYIW